MSEVVVGWMVGEKNSKPAIQDNADYEYLECLHYPDWLVLPLSPLRGFLLSKPEEDTGDGVGAPSAVSPEGERWAICPVGVRRLGESTSPTP